MNIPLALTLSILPDIDLLAPVIQHGGLTHSLVVYLILAFPAILVWRRQALPYVIAVASHPLLGDFLTRPSRAQGVQLLFPLSSSWFSAGSEQAAVAYIYAELVLFAVLLASMITTRDVRMLVRPHRSNLLFAIPVATVLLPAFLEFPLPVPAVLIVPHVVLIALLTVPVLVDFKYVLLRLTKR